MSVPIQPPDKAGNNIPNILGKGAYFSPIAAFLSIEEFSIITRREAEHQEDVFTSLKALKDAAKKVKKM